MLGNPCKKCSTVLNEINASKKGINGICKSCRNFRDRRKDNLCLTCNNPSTRKPKSMYCSDYCRIIKYVNKTENCWLWTGTIDKYGYGSTKLFKRMSPHRVFYTLFIGEISSGMLVCHKCDVRNCVNPDHLFLGTNDDNMKDMALKKRIHSKLSDQDVLNIRNEAKNYYYGMYVDLARKYMVHPVHIRNIVTFKKRRHV